ncbi:MAG: hypothetical protein IJ761_06990 [Bacteroidales bacterium]|nr:hypothetical protein [Bacteroidales bacterium]
MRKNFLLAVFVILTATLFAQTEPREAFLQQHMSAYPQSRLLDIYKSCFQDYMGAEHLVADRDRAMAYLEYELTQCNADTIAPRMYEYCGVTGQHVRVSLLTILDGRLTKDELLDAFLRSANSHSRPSVDDWNKEWHKILATVEAADLDLPNFDSDKTAIETLLNRGEYATSHSANYRTAYQPHYRIVERSIFEKEILPKLGHKR